MSTPIPKPSGSDISWALNYCNIPHTTLEPTQQYALSEISDNCRSKAATFLRCHIPKKSLRDKLHYLTTQLAKGDYMLVGRKGKDIKLGLMQKHDHILFHIDRRIVLLGDGVFDKKHPLEDEFEHVDIAYFLCAKFEEAHLVRPLLYRRRKAKQLKKVIDKRDAADKKRKIKGKGAKDNKVHADGKSKKSKQSKKKIKMNNKTDVS